MYFLNQLRGGGRVLLTLLAVSPFLGVEAADPVEVFVGSEICVTDYVMDNFCIARGTLLDPSGVVSLGPDGPIDHTLHCLIDVPQCIKSPYEILKKLDNGNYGRAWRLESNDLVVAHAKGVGKCDECDGSGTQVAGYKATIFADVLDLGSDNVPALIKVTSVFDDTLGCGGVEYAVPSMVTGDGSGSGLSLNQKILIHGSLMLIGWGFLLPSGVIIARLARHRPGSLWFKAHIIIQPFALLLTIIAWSIALHNFRALESGKAAGKSYTHAVFGMITMVIGIFQPINAIFRPHPPAEGESKSVLRLTWEIVHKALGYAAAFILAPVTIVLGTQLVPNPKDGEGFQIAYGVFAIVLIMLIIGLVLDKRSTSTSENDEPAADKKLAVGDGEVVSLNA
mmetsp:Transcript_17545/g.26257  ORF Transcript_17545/g.26257 Transcript_17545/m.26257 type:complete len:394 (-) Transcript_17545:79-1260(-)